jgi:hypothetical protein
MPWLVLKLLAFLASWGGWFMGLSGLIPFLKNAIVAALEILASLAGIAFRVLGKGFAACCKDPSAFSVVLLALILGRVLYPDGFSGPVVKNPLKPRAAAVSVEKPKPAKKKKDLNPAAELLCKISGNC